MGEYPIPLRFPLSTSRPAGRCDSGKPAGNDHETVEGRDRDALHDASHELRAPVSLIRTTAEVAVQKRDRPAAEYLQALDEVVEEAERTSQLVDSLMLLARADSGKEAVDSTAADMCAIGRGAVEQGEKLARIRGLQFSAHVPNDPIWIQADADALRRALLILIDNAAKYTPPGGAITVGFEARDGFAVASVADTGIGIASEDVAHVFDRFWRADKARSREQTGAGLGLSIAKWIVEMHQGSIGVESKLGKGSTFWIRVPLDRALTRDVASSSRT